MDVDFLNTFEKSDKEHSYHTFNIEINQKCGKLT